MVGIAESPPGNIATTNRECATTVIRTGPPIIAYPIARGFPLGPTGGVLEFCHGKVKRLSMSSGRANHERKSRRGQNFTRHEPQLTFETQKYSQARREGADWA